MWGPLGWAGMQQKLLHKFSRLLSLRHCFNLLGCDSTALLQAGFDPRFLKPYSELGITSDLVVQVRSAGARLGCPCCGSVVQLASCLGHWHACMFLHA